MSSVKLMTIVGILRSRYATVRLALGQRNVNRDVAQIVIVNPESFVTTSSTQISLNVIKIFAEVIVTAT